MLQKNKFMHVVKLGILFFLFFLPHLLFSDSLATTQLENRSFIREAIANSDFSFSTKEVVFREKLQDSVNAWENAAFIQEFVEQETLVSMQARIVEVVFGDRIVTTQKPSSPKPLFCQSKDAMFVHTMSRSNLHNVPTYDSLYSSSLLQRGLENQAMQLPLLLAKDKLHRYLALLTNSPPSLSTTRSQSCFII
ncbi:MAG: hypothetical protein AAF518_09115 [Spirochaetota bacterium]